MNSTLRRLSLLVSASLAIASGADAQDFASILNAIEANNLELKALRADADASAAELSAANAPAGLSAEYSPFWQRGESGVASSELIVSQEFEFPTLYAERRRGNALRRQADTLRYAAARREILIQARLQCLELARLNTEAAILNRRRAFNARVLLLTDRLEASGNVTALDLNKAKIESMTLDAAEARNAAATSEAKAFLRILNGGIPVELDTLSLAVNLTPLPDYDTFRRAFVDADPATLAALADIAIASQDSRTAARSWLPSVTAGYRRNTEGHGPSLNGFIVGLSFPLWSTRAATRAAASRRRAAEYRAADAQARAEADFDGAYRQLLSLRSVIDAYDPDIFASTLELLARSLDAGLITATDYYAEADAIYTKWQELLDARFLYASTLARIKNNE